MKEHLIVKVEAWAKEDTQKTHGLIDEDSLYIVHSKKVQPNERFTVFDEDNNPMIDTTIDDILENAYVKPRTKVQKLAHLMWGDNELDALDKKRLIQLYKNYYPEFYASFEVIHPNIIHHKSIDEYYDLFMKELNNYKSNI